MDSAVGGVAHHAVEGRPYGPENPRRRTEGRLLPEEVFSLRVYC